MSSSLLLALFVCASGAPRTPTERGDFVWGAAASAHQTEGAFGGGEHGDWWALEHDPTAHAIRDGDTADVATDHWHRYAEDFRLARAMGLDSVRISLAWEKIEPEPGVFSADVIAHYRDVLVSMRNAGLRPMVALHHFSHPLWFHAQGGWENGASAVWFLRYAAHVERTLGDLCDLWITFNEPAVLVHLGYLKGSYPPLRRSPLAALRAAMSLARAHQLVVAWFHATSAAQGPATGAGRGASPDGLSGIGLVNSLQFYAPADPTSTLDRLVARTLDDWANWRFLDVALGPSLLPESWALRLGSTQVDWLGVNYYGRFLMRAAVPMRAPCPADEPVADNGWCLYPDGLEQVLRATAARYPLPLIVGENGLADATDALRPDILRRSLAALDRAKQDLDVRGYYHWSLTDNFEWLHGNAFRFGLIEVKKDLSRVPRPSAGVFQEEIARRKGLPDRARQTTSAP